MTDEEFARFHKDKYCSPTAHLEGRKRIELLEELAAAVSHWRGVQDRLPRVFNALNAIDRDNKRVKRLRERYDRGHAEGKEQLLAKTLFPKKT